MQQETVSIADTQTQLATYLMETRNDTAPTSALEFWLTSKTRYPSLCPLVLDRVHAPASVAYAERVFNVCGDLTSGKRNRTSTKKLKSTVHIMLAVFFLILSRTAINCCPQHTSSSNTVRQHTQHASRRTGSWRTVQILLQKTNGLQIRRT